MKRSRLLGKVPVTLVMHTLCAIVIIELRNRMNMYRRKKQHGRKYTQKQPGRDMSFRLCVHSYSIKVGCKGTKKLKECKETSKKK